MIDDMSDQYDQRWVEGTQREGNVGYAPELVKINNEEIQHKTRQTTEDEEAIWFHLVHDCRLLETP
jgi:hypothetical protein